MPRGSALPRSAAVAALGLAVLAAIPTFALAQTSAPPPGASAVSQYAEQIPGAQGATAPGVGEVTKTPLPAAGRDALASSPAALASVLEEIATSSDYGAPVSNAREPGSQDDGSAGDGSFGGTVGTIGSASDARLLGLVLTLVVTTLAAAALAMRRGQQV